MKLSKSKLTIKTKRFENTETPYPDSYPDFDAHLKRLRKELSDFREKSNPTVKTKSFEILAIPRAHENLYPHAYTLKEIRIGLNYSYILLKQFYEKMTSPSAPNDFADPQSHRNGHA